MLPAKVRFGVMVALGAALLGGGRGGQASRGLETPQPKGGADGVKPAAGPKSLDAPQHSLQLASARIGSANFRFPGQGMIAGFPDGRKALVFEPNSSKPARLVDLTTGSTIRAYPGWSPCNGHRGLALAAGDRAVYCDNAGALCVVDLKTGTVERCEAVMQSVSEAHPITVSGDGRRVAVASGRRSVGKHTGQVLVYDVPAAKVVADVRIDGFDVRGAALSADGKRFAVLGLGVDPPGQQARRVDLFEVRDIESGKTVSRMDRSVEGYGIPAHFSPDGKHLAISMWPGVEVCDTATGRSVWKEEQQVTTLRFTPDSGRLCAGMGFGAVRVWDAASGKPVSFHKLPSTAEVDGRDSADLVVTPDGRLLGFGWRGLVLSMWDVEAGKLLTPTDGSAWPITAVRFTPDGREVIAATDALTVFRAEARTGRIIARFDPKLTDEQRADRFLSVHPTHMAAVTLSPDSRFLAYRTRAKSPHLGMIDWAAGRVLWIASASSVMPVLVRTVRWCRRAATSNQGAKARRASNYSNPVAGLNASVAFAPDGTKMAVVARRSGLDGDQLLARDLVARQPLATVSGRFGQWFAVGPDSRTLVMTETNRIVGRDLVTGSVTRWLDFLPHPGREGPEFVRRREQPPKFPPDRVGWHLTCPFTFSPDGRLFAVGVISPETGEPQVRVYEWAGFGHRFTLTGHAGSVRSLAFSPDGTFLASGSDDTTVLVWDLAKVWRAASPKVPSAGESLWTRLIGRETAPAWEAMRELAARPEIAVPLLKERLKPAQPPTVSEADIPALIKQLDADAFPERQRAAQGLRQLGPKAIPHLQQTLKNPPSLEMKRRVEQLLEEAGRPDPAFPMPSRTVEVLEHIGGSDARAVLQSLSGGPPGHALTEEARAALRRMKS